jgi:hypothetical protein
MPRSKLATATYETQFAPYRFHAAAAKRIARGVSRDFARLSAASELSDDGSREQN